MQQFLQQQPPTVQLDEQLLATKKQLLSSLLQNPQDPQQAFLQYPHPQLQALAQQQLKEHGQLLFLRTSSTIYFGNICNDLYHGLGVLLYTNSPLRFYEGHFQNNCKYGLGMEYINGDIYLGKFINNKPEDQHGVFMWSNGDVYHGSFLNGMKHGIGKWQSGDEFYSGRWKFNKPEGQGYIRSSLSEYNGDIKNGYKHGQGIELFHNGDRYEGMYSNGKPEGQGTYAWANGSIYKGEFKNGLRYGHGVWQYGSQKYQGPYVNDKRNGEGSYYWSGGSYYKGSFVEDLRHGYGEMHWEDDSFYRGDWSQGAQHGEGEIWQKGKLIQKGVFQNGKFREQSQQQQFQDNQRRLAPLNTYPNKLPAATHRNSQIPSFQPKKQRFNSFHAHNEKYKQHSTHTKKDKVFHQSFYDKKNQALLERRRQINKRYSFLDRVADERRGHSHNFKLPLKKSNQKSGGNETAINDNNREVANSIAKIQIYKKLRNEKKTQNFAKKLNTTNRQPNSFQKDIMFETDLGPIKWTNFTHVGTH